MQVTIRYEDNNGKIKEKTFKNEDAMITWCDKQEAAGKTINVLAYSYN